MGTSTTRSRRIDPDMLASDLADTFADYHGIDLGDDQIRQALPVILAAVGLDTHGRPLVPAQRDNVEPTPAPLTEHTCRSKAAGGNYDPDCQRCAELLAGAPPRSAPEWVHRYYAAKVAGDPGDLVYAAEIKAHFGRGGRHNTDCNTTTCTFTWK